jgi:hypothetical protein
MAGANKRLSIAEKKHLRDAQSARVFASTNCVHYRECRDRAAFSNREMKCHRCDEMEIQDGVYQKEVALSNLSSGGLQEHPEIEHVGVIPAGDGPKKPYMGSRKMEHTQSAEQTKICRDPNCEHGGQPQPIDEFGVHGRWGTRLNVCNACLAKKRSLGQQRRHKNNAPPKTDAPAKTNINETDRASADNTRPKKSINNTKNKLTDLNNHLFMQIERLGDENLSGDELKMEIERSRAISGVANQIINNVKVCVDGMKAFNEGLIKKAPPMLGFEVHEEL